jgi:hypothetical protein
MKFLYIYLLLLITSCSAPKLYQQGVSKIEKAIEKDSTLAFPTDTIRTVQFDTIQGIDGKDSIIIQKETIEIPCDFDVEAFKESVKKKSRRELRFERKASKDSLSHLRKMYKLGTKRLQDSLNFQKKLNKELTKRLDDQTDTEVKLAKEETKQQKGSWFTRKMGEIWWLLLIIGLVIGFYLGRKIPQIPNPFKRK